MDLQVKRENTQLHVVRDRHRQHHNRNNIFHLFYIFVSSISANDIQKCTVGDAVCIIESANKVLASFSKGKIGIKQNQEILFKNSILHRGTQWHQFITFGSVVHSKIDHFTR